MASRDIDYTGARALGELIGQFEQEGIRVAIARASQLVHRDLNRAGLLNLIGTNRLFTSVDQAVRELEGPRSPSSGPSPVVGTGASLPATLVCHSRFGLP